MLIVLGAPVFIAMRAREAVVLVQRMIGGMTSFTFLAIPLFLLAGEIMSRGGLTDRLMDFARALVGHFRAGLAQVNIASSLMFASISGSAYADVAAMGPIMIPAMQKEGYPRGFAGALTAASATLSPLFPLSIVLIVYGSAFGVSIGALFAAGLTIALVMTLLFAIVTYIVVLRYKVPSYGWPGMRALVRTGRRAALPLGMPLIVVGGILGGFFTATEAVVVAVTYGLVLTVVVYRSLHLRDLLPILRSTAISSAAITILVGAAAMFSYVVVRLLIGPIIVPIMTMEIGFSDVQTAMIIVSALGVGHLTPPFGGTLLTASLIGRMSVVEISRYAWPFILIKIFLTGLIVGIPLLSEWLPRTLGSEGSRWHRPTPRAHPCAPPFVPLTGWRDGSTARRKR